MAARYLPDSAECISAPQRDPSSRYDPDYDLLQEDINMVRYLLAYKSLDFGVKFVTSLVKLNRNTDKPLPWPAFLGDKHRPLYRLYCYMRSGGRIWDEHVMTAHAWTKGTREGEGRLLKGLLMSRNADVQRIAASMGVSEEAIRIFEQGWFNIMDRKHERMWLSQKIYPRTRLVEASPDYMSNAAAENLYMRSGFNNDMEDVAWLAGILDDGIASSDAGESAQRLETVLMTTGYLLARNGFAFQHNVKGIDAARGLIAAAKQAGIGTQQAGDMPSSIGERILQSLTQKKRADIVNVSREQDATLIMEDATP